MGNIVSEFVLKLHLTVTVEPADLCPTTVETITIRLPDGTPERQAERLVQAIRDSLEKRQLFVEPLVIPIPSTDPNDLTPPSD